MLKQEPGMDPYSSHSTTHCSGTHCREAGSWGAPPENGRVSWLPPAAHAPPTQGARSRHSIAREYKEYVQPPAAHAGHREVIGGKAVNWGSVGHQAHNGHHLHNAYRYVEFTLPFL